MNNCRVEECTGHEWGDTELCYNHWTEALGILRADNGPTQLDTIQADQALQTAQLIEIKELLKQIVKQPFNGEPGG